MDSEANYIDINRHSWNNRTDAHMKSEFYDLEGFMNGRSSLNDIELNLLGDLNGKSILHLQCHFGQDTLSWSRMGAKCTGIDLSDEGIKLAQNLNDELKLVVVLTENKIIDKQLFKKSTKIISKITFGYLWSSSKSFRRLPTISKI